jgi:hypothetical protein
MGRRWHAVAALCIAYIVAAAVAADDKGLSSGGTVAAAPSEANTIGNTASSGGATYHHVWPVCNGRIKKPFCFCFVFAQFGRQCHSCQ